MWITLLMECTNRPKIKVFFYPFLVLFRHSDSGNDIRFTKNFFSYNKAGFTHKSLVQTNGINIFYAVIKNG